MEHLWGRIMAMGNARWKLRLLARRLSEDMFGAGWVGYCFGSLIARYMVSNGGVLVPALKVFRADAACEM
jgi:uncharacterized membrane protein